MTESICSLLGINRYSGDDIVVADDYTDGYEDFDELLEEFADLSDFYRSFSFHRVNGDSPFEYGGNACTE